MDQFLSSRLLKQQDFKLLAHTYAVLLQTMTPSVYFTTSPPTHSHTVYYGRMKEVTAGFKGAAE